MPYDFEVMGRARTSEVTVVTREVVPQFISRIAHRPKWKRIWLVSPWISPMDSPGSLNFNQVLQRLQTDDCTTYVVTRPPDQDWHRDALNALRDTGCASIVLNPALHAKIYVAETASHNCGLLGSNRSVPRLSS